jgi:glycosyltransferase involved in cell wall biosynthesis
MMTPKYTVFTPAYNRAHTIARVYQSLQSQSFRDFEWIVIDDGSVDNTEELVRQWQAQADFPIIYRYQPNSGKHIAFNRAVEMARGELFLVIDSDDAFLPESLATMLYWWEDIPLAQREGFTGIVSLCQYEDGSTCGKGFPCSPFDTNALDLKFKTKLREETWGFHRTEVLKKYPFPENPDVRFVPENLIWDDIARHYKIRCINQPLRIFYQDSGNQVTKADPRKKALVKAYFLEFLNRDLDYFFHDPRTFAKWATLYVRYSLHLGDWSCIKPSRFRRAGACLLCWGALPIGAAVYLRDRLLAGRAT